MRLLNRENGGRRVPRGDDTSDPLIRRGCPWSRRPRRRRRTSASLRSAGLPRMTFSLRPSRRSFWPTGDDDLDVLVVDRDALAAVDLPDLRDHVAVHGL